MDKATWERMGEVLKNALADPPTFCLWALVKDAIDDSKDRKISQALATAQEQALECKEERLSEKAPSKANSVKDGPYKALGAALEDLKLTDDELDPGEEVDLEEAAAKYHNENWPPDAPSAPPMAFP